MLAPSSVVYLPNTFSFVLHIAVDQIKESVLEICSHECNIGGNTYTDTGAVLKRSALKHANKGMFIIQFSSSGLKQYFLALVFSAVPWLIPRTVA